MQEARLSNKCSLCRSMSTHPQGMGEILARTGDDADDATDDDDDGGGNAVPNAC